MTFIQYGKKVIARLSEVAEKTGYSLPGLLGSFASACLRLRVDIDEFCFFRMYDYTNRKRASYLTLRECIKISNRLIAGAAPEDLSEFGEKHRFNALFRDFVHRDWLYLPESTPEQIRAFVARNPRFLAKASFSTYGKNITLHESASLDLEAFIAEYQQKPYLLEAAIEQLPVMAALNPTSVNTVRIVTACHNGKVLVVGACLRCGGAGAHVDNFHSGGVAYPIHLEEGIVSGPGRSFSEETFFRHPPTGHIMPGFEIPRWQELKDAACRAALVLPRVGFVGWDVAITEDGLDFVEGNVDLPDPLVIQFDGGVLPRLSAFLND